MSFGPSYQQVLFIILQKERKQKQYRIQKSKTAEVCARWCLPMLGFYSDDVHKNQTKFIFFVNCFINIYVYLTFGLFSLPYNKTMAIPAAEVFKSFSQMTAITIYRDKQKQRFTHFFIEHAVIKKSKV